MIVVDGEKTDVLSAADRGLAYGDGLFETIAIFNKKARLLRLHLARLAKGMRRLGIGWPRSLTGEMNKAVALAENAAVLKLIVTRGDGGRGYAPSGAEGCRRIIQLSPFPADYQQKAASGITADWAEVRLATNPLTAGLKTLNRLEQVLARRQPSAADELIMRDYEGNVIEAVAANLFMVKGGIIHTPDLSGSGVEGVMRQFVLESCPKLGLEVKIRRIAEAELAAADEAFLTNALRGIHPLVRLGEGSYPIGGVAKILQHHLDRYGN